MQRINHWIGGRQVASTSGRSGPVYDPATGRQTAEVDLASVEEVDDAVRVATDAAAGWGATSLARRTQVLFAMRELVLRHRDDLAAA